ncbi:DoxX family protein [Panacibacter ginsenosidivorans]|uniref:DoxX family protein n=1 Tax=Panacibacter ginsenosidivorans TaxID=1813871 RepID=A0A5B8VI57_9BACT|nr:DoxX family protein [Panacibacter ginsenosidivorans]QEC69968.1 DoxX family protein [Panacibacter ginsenosidivorans]
MKKLLSTQYSAGAFNFAILLARLSFGILMIMKHGIPHLMEFSSLQYKFYNFLGIGSRFSLVLVLFAELFCSMFLILGLFTRFAVIPLVIVMMVVIFSVNAGKPFINSELAVLYATVFIAILFVGPGRISIDGMMRG